jgi:branched-chain amino acid transport system permease protein
VIVAFISIRLKDSRLGRAWMAMREDEDVAEAMGIDLVKTKLMAFATGAAFAGLSGAIFATKLTSIYPHSFHLLISINVLCLIIVGGMGSIPGVIVGALALVGLPEILREFAEYRLLMYGAALVVMMLLRPEGLLPEARRRLELHEAEGGE